MGTKQKPGKFDCYSKAHPDEPMFILLARDPLAPILVKLWVELRLGDSNYMSEKTEEALITATAMREWRTKNG